MKIIHNIKQCIGCGACQAVCPKYFEMGADGKAHLKGGKKTKNGEELEIKKLDCAQAAADTCPVGAIKIEKN